MADPVDGKIVYAFCARLIISVSVIDHYKAE